MNHCGTFGGGVTAKKTNSALSHPKCSGAIKGQTRKGLYVK